MIKYIEGIEEAKVSVIIPNYNHANYLPQRIESVLQQTYPHFEILILDDYSLDNSRSIIESYVLKDSRISSVFNTENSGSTFKQWSKGLSLTNGKYIWIAESDDYADPTFLEKLVSRLETDPTVGLVYADSWYVYQDKKTIERNPEFYKQMDATLWSKDFVLDGSTLITKFMSYSNIIPNASAVVLRRATIEQVALPDGSWRLVGDWLYWTSIMAISRVAFVAEPLNYFRFHDNNVRSTKVKQGLALVEILRLLVVIRKYGTPAAALFQKKLDECVDYWIHCLFNLRYKIPFSRHRELFYLLGKLDKNFKKNIWRKILSYGFYKVSGRIK
ncbi:glycosyltransferase [Hymenobacter defluvii]|uniref:Glycosyltransferase family 2 protein n=1 Tax=Hymenobacter defluvii TaxID=2054411 RepID=A0ABS3THW3_9BACT|nr:glycosyltransferase family 2 protein [Hymenobacter defluvii]MBO3273250.1 glycosyltransferase family 2 protein [Hymenobacter defluvii]